MNQLVVHQDVHALVAGDRLEGKVQRRDLDGDDVAGDTVDAAALPLSEMSVEQQHDRLLRMEIKQPPLKRERVEKRPRGVRHEKGLLGSR